MPSSRKIGIFGEKIAGNYLIKYKYQVLLKNHKEGFDEIDIVARDPEGTLIFCEVKTISKTPTGGSIFLPEDHLTRLKLKKLERSSQHFISRHPSFLYGDMGWRIDLIAITLSDFRVAKFSHYKNIEL